MKRVLITGITGFAGSFLAEELVKDTSLEIHGTYLSEKSLANLATIKEKVKLAQINLTDYEQVDTYIAEIKPDEVYHLAALPSPAQSFKEPALFFQNNINAQLHVLEALRKYSLINTRILIISSAEVYGLVSGNDLPMDENTPLNPVSPYGVSKIAQDFLGLQYFNAYKMPVIRVRPFGHVGPRLSDQFAASIFAKKIAEIEKGTREPVLTVGNLSAKRDLTDVRDVIRGYILLMEKGHPGDVYNLGSGVSYMIEEVLNTLLASSSKEITISVDKELLRPNDIPELRCDTSKITDLTGWKPEIMLETSLKDTLDYWRGIV